MRVYIITYDIKLAWLRNYKPFFAAIQSYPHWMHHMDNTWFIVTDATPEQIYSSLAPYIYADCRILIARVTSDYFGLLSQDAWTWLNAFRYMM
jgi:hypothetical protein